MNPTNNTILITGGGSGIGRGLAEAFLKAGNQVIIAGRRREALKEVTDANPGMKAVSLDIGSPAAIRAFAAQVASEFPKLNVLINSAGIMKPENLLASPENLADAEAMITTNLLGTMRLTSRVAAAAEEAGEVDDYDGFVRFGVFAAGDDADVLCDEGGDSFLFAVVAVAVEGDDDGGDRVDSAVCADAADGSASGGGSAGDAAGGFCEGDDADSEIAAGGDGGGGRTVQAVAFRGGEREV